MVTKRLLSRTMLSALVIAGAAFLFLGCPGELENPERFLDGGTAACPDITGKLFPQRCGGSICHEGKDAAAGLDLVAPGVESRLVDKPARDCPGLLVDPILPESSLLYKKLLPLPDCGSPMPIGRPTLTFDELECVREWIAAQTPVQ